MEFGSENLEGGIRAKGMGQSASGIVIGLRLDGGIGNTGFGEITISERIDLIFFYRKGEAIH